MSNIQFISELIDEISFEKPLDWESINYESIKEIAIIEAFQKYHDIMSMEVNDREASMVSILAYLMMENTMAWITINKNKIH